MACHCVSLPARPPPPPPSHQCGRDEGVEEVGGLQGPQLGVVQLLQAVLHGGDGGQGDGLGDGGGGVGGGGGGGGKKGKRELKAVLLSPAHVTGDIIISTSMSEVSSHRSGVKADRNSKELLVQRCVGSAAAMQPRALTHHLPA